MASEQNGALDYWRKKCEEDRKKKVEVRKEFYRSNGFNMDTPMTKEVDVVNRVQCDPVPSRRSVREMVKMIQESDPQPPSLPKNFITRSLLVSKGSKWIPLQHRLAVRDNKLEDIYPEISVTEVDVEEDVEGSVDHEKRNMSDRFDHQERISINFEENHEAVPEKSIDPEENSTVEPEERMSVDMEESGTVDPDEKSSVDPKESTTVVMTNWGSLIEKFWNKSSIKQAFLDEIEESKETDSWWAFTDPDDSNTIYSEVSSTVEPEESIDPEESISAIDSDESYTVDFEASSKIEPEEIILVKEQEPDMAVGSSGHLEYVAAESMPFTLTFPVEYRFHGKINGKHCSRIKDFRRKYNVTIEFDHKGNLVIVGTRGRCDEALQAMKRIKGLVAKWKLGDTVVPKVRAESSSVDANRIITEEDIPWTVKFPVENRFHSIINGRGYRRLRGLKKKYNVGIEYDYSGNIVITGTRGKCEDAMKRIKGVIARQVTATQENSAVDPGKRRSAGPVDSISVDLDESSEVDPGESGSVDPKERTAVTTNWGSLIKEFWGKSSIRKAFFVEIEESSEADSWWAVTDD